ncbi:toll/interleukin-1 receptor domain-containing protein [aff. Roholtiella sp. LEGE 12411]|uniref:toll/interleukin-1 receptor domain-containing protein n=1 Tax=aff. Roholtiella sp. LEGE 12411 TaxID=1828822 RepID=UPI00188103FB|nr:toll/interleukin-1 receptor domain-containing protein [aff. Roholtiella sp. LEGE 12411]MBE9036473.1 toll/interleukin-1 receptor domain-containing protein [aff. Roholtiella sp. LEGE 12411]
MNGRNSEVCLLYSESDKAIANLLEDALNYYSINIWKTQNISIGSKIISETIQVLEKAEFVIVLWSSNSIKSALLKDLASEAKKNKKVLIPVLIQGVRIPGEFLDIQPANLVDWDGDHENEQIVKLWRLIQDKVLNYRSKKVGFSQFITVFSLVLTCIGVILTIATPEVRCFLKLQCPENLSSGATPQLPSETNSPEPVKAIPIPQPSIENPLVNKTPIPLPSNPPSPSFTDKSNSNNQQTVEVNGLIFKLQSCKRLKQDVRCDVLITNTLKDRKIRLYANYSYKSKFLDIEGLAYLAESIEIDAVKVTAYTDTQLIQNANVKLSINFVEIPSQVNQIQVLDIAATALLPYKELQGIQFRNIVLSK